MFCKNGGKKYFMVLGFLGLISLVIGIINYTFESRLPWGRYGGRHAVRIRNLFHSDFSYPQISGTFCA